MSNEEERDELEVVSYRLGDLLWICSESHVPDPASDPFLKDWVTLRAQDFFVRWVQGADEVVELILRPSSAFTHAVVVNDLSALSS